MLISVLKLHYPNSEYLGDGMYAASNDHEIILFTTDGVVASNMIILEPVVAMALSVYLAKKGLKA